MQRPDSPALEEGPRKDKGYRRYASNVERALSLFDTALQEWADYIAFLGRLLKALQSRPSDTSEIPHKAVVAKRLAQCLAPNLPSGVHQKTLDVYAYVFSILGNIGLSRDLPLWLPGLSPLLSYASLSVKPTLLSLFETFIVPLHPGILRSAIKAIILALLPGLEEETSEEFERALSLLNKLKSAIPQDSAKSPIPADVAGDQYFWQSLFLASITSSSRRQGALAYMIRELPQLGHPTNGLSETKALRNIDKTGLEVQLPPSIQAVTNPEPGLLIRCFAAGLQDGQLLIQRGFLDLLVSHLPLHSIVFRKTVVAKDVELLVVAAASVVARREMSLNRRLWTWFLGPQTSAENNHNTTGSPSSPDSDSMPNSSKDQNILQTKYFERYGLGPLVSGILKMVNKNPLNPAERARPFRICLSLMDRWEIGGLLIPRLFMPVVESVCGYQKIAPSKDALTDVLRSANVFFDGVESSLIWAELIRVLTDALDSKENSTEIDDKPRPDAALELVLFVITKFNIREDEMLALHIPMATLALLISLRFRLGAPQTQDPSEEPCTSNLLVFRIITHLLDAIPQRTFASNSPPHEVLPSNSRQMLGDIQHFYESLRGGSGDVHPPLKISVVREAMLHNASQIARDMLNASPIRVDYFERATSLLDKTLRKAPKFDEYEYEQLITSLGKATGNLALNNGDLPPFPTLAAMISMLETIKYASPQSRWESDHRVRQILPNLLIRLWEYTSPRRPKHNVEAVRCLWRIHWISPDYQFVEGSIATFLSQGESGYSNDAIQIEGARRFITFWAHSITSSHPSTNRSTSVTRSSQKSATKATSLSNDFSLLVRPLLLLLDSLDEEKTEVSFLISAWLQSLSSAQKIVDIVLYRLQMTTFIEDVMSSEVLTNEQLDKDKTNTSNDSEECLYYLRTILKLLQCSPANFWTTLVNSTDARDTTLNGEESTEVEAAISIQLYLAKLCIKILKRPVNEQGGNTDTNSSLYQACVLLLHQIVLVESSDIVIELALDKCLIKTLSWAIGRRDILLQKSLMELILQVLQKQSQQSLAAPPSHRRQTSRDTPRSSSQLSLHAEKMALGAPAPTPELLDCLILGIASPNSHPILDHWIRFMNECLPFYTGNAFQTLMPLVDCFIRTVEAVFQNLKALFEDSNANTIGQSEHITTLNILLNGLEHVLARGHEQLLQDEGHAASVRSPEQVQGFFGNMVSGVFAPEAQKSRAATANNRLTVLLCFKDAVRLSFIMWSWGDLGHIVSPRDNASSASFNYTSLRLRNRTRRILDHLFAAEALECLETLIEIWQQAGSTDGISESSTVFNLLHALEGSRPKNTIPALFNAIYSRTNPNVLDPMRKSTLTSELSDSSLAIFLVAYTQSMEDDALDEIWTDCMTFLRDVLGNPLPHRLTLPTLLQFTAILGEKIDNTNFGEQRKMRRDIGDLFVRLLAATFTIKPLAFPQDSESLTNGGDGTHESSKRFNTRNTSVPEDIVSITASILPNISKILIDTDRITAATTTISTQILAPTLRWKGFPHNVTNSTLEILKTMSRIPEASKIWRKDIAEIFNDSRFFCASSLDIIQQGWMPILRQLVLLDKDRVADILSRLSSPASAGIMFGVGASSARLEADRKAQLNLRRIALLILSADHDTFVTNLGLLQEKLSDLMAATVASSPSSSTRADIYMVLRSLIQKVTPVHLASLWPIISTELHEALSSLNTLHTNAKYNVTAVLQAAKLLDTLLLTAPDDFQLREWLFITDTIDAVYRPPDWRPTALVDELAESLDAKAGARQSGLVATPHIQQGRQHLLTWDAVHDVPEGDLVDRILRPFLRQLSITAFESTYQMEASDLDECVQDLLQDLFDEKTLV